MDRVLVDAPCTGTGIWRRRPDAKWRVTPDALQKRIAEQDAVLAQAAPFLKPGGVLAYATCSLLREEGSDRIDSFRVAHPDLKPVPIGEAWRESLQDASMPGDGRSEDSLILSPYRTGTDGFFLSLLRRAA